MINIDKVSKNLGDKQILKDITLNIEKGSIFGLIGPNGAGKTTLIKCLTGIYQVNSGEITIKNMKVYNNNEVKEFVGYVPDEDYKFFGFTVRDLIRFYKLAYKNFHREIFDKLNIYFKIPEKMSIGKLSKGMKMRLSIMLTLSIKPQVLIMDEPTSGLDPLVKKAVLNLIVDTAAENGTTVVISSHNLNDLERICDSVAIIDRGVIKYTNSIENMKTSIKKFQIVFNGQIPEEIKQWQQVLNLSCMGRVCSLVVTGEIEQFQNKINSLNPMLCEELDLSLEDMFIYSMGGDSMYEGLF